MPQSLSNNDTTGRRINVQDLFQLATEKGITIEYCNIPLNESMSVQDDDGDFVLMDYSLINDGANEIVHLGHELGHSMTGSFYNVYAPLDVRQKHENRADKWAIERLVPKEELDLAVKSGHTEIWDLAEMFNVTEPFMRKAAWWYTHGNMAVEM